MFYNTVSDSRKPSTPVCSGRVACAGMPPKDHASHFEEGFANLNGEEHESE